MPGRQTLAMHDVLEPDVQTAISAYAQGLFPMDDAVTDGPLPFYRADPRAIIEIDAGGLARLRRRLRRSLSHDPGWQPRIDTGFEAVLEGCMAPRGGGEWLTPRLARLYRRLNVAGFSHSFELWDADVLAAGILGVVVGRAAMLESMFHTIPDAGNVCLVRTLEGLAAGGIELCDIQLTTEHTVRLGAREIAADEYDRRLADALRLG